MKKHSDLVLHEIAWRFQTLPPFPESDETRAAEILASGALLKHVAKFPHQSTLFGVRYHIAGKTRFFAYVPSDRLDDGLRFADACTLCFWKYRRRQPEQPDAAQFNFSIEAARADLVDWLESRKDISNLIIDIEHHLLAVGVFAPPETARRSNRKTVRGEVASLRALVLELHQEVLAMIINRS